MHSDNKQPTTNNRQQTTDNKQLTPMIKEDVLTALSTLGFIPEELDGFGYRFEFEGFSLLYSPEDEDATCINISMPNVFDITPDNRTAVLEAMARLCTNLKYVQPQIICGSNVWLNYQHFLGENEVTADLMEHMVHVLAFSVCKFHEYINNDENDH